LYKGQPLVALLKSNAVFFLEFSIKYTWV